MKKRNLLSIGLLALATSLRTAFASAVSVIAKKQAPKPLSAFEAVGIIYGEFLTFDASEEFIFTSDTHEEADEKFHCKK